MKTKLLLTAIAMTFFGALNAQNLILNADFEIVASNVFESWSTSTANEVRLQAPSGDPLTDRTVNGTNCVRLSAASNYSELKQTVTVEPGETYDISFRGRISDGAGMEGAANTDRVLYCVLEDDLGAKLADIGNVPTSTNTTVTGEYIVPAGITSITIKLYKEKQADLKAGIAYFDDVSIVKRTSTAVDDEFATKTYAYPNPTSGITEVSSDDVISSYSLFNSTGQLLETVVVNQASVQVDLSAYANGLYVISTTDAAGSVQVLKVYKK